MSQCESVFLGGSRQACCKKDDQKKKTAESDNTAKEKAIACIVSPQAIVMRRAALRAQTAT
jgi:hypothetical protein